MARCERCNGCEAMWGTGPCKWCGFPGADTRRNEMTQDIKKRVEKSFYECFFNLRVAQFIGKDYLTQAHKENFNYAVIEAEKNCHKAIKELFEREEGLIAALKFYADEKNWIERTIPEKIGAGILLKMGCEAHDKGKAAQATLKELGIE